MSHASPIKLLVLTTLLAAALLLAACGEAGEQAAPPEPPEMLMPELSEPPSEEMGAVADRFLVLEEPEVEEMVAAEPELTPEQQAALVARCKTAWETETVITADGLIEFDIEAYPECGEPPYPFIYIGGGLRFHSFINSEKLLLVDCRSAWVSGSSAPAECGNTPDLPGLEMVVLNPCRVLFLDGSTEYLGGDSCEGASYVTETGSPIFRPPPLPPLGDPSQCVVEEPPAHIEPVDFTTQSRIHEGGEPYPPGTFPRRAAYFSSTPSNFGPDIDIPTFRVYNQLIVTFEERPADPCSAIQSRLREGRIQYDLIEVRSADYYAPHMEAYGEFVNQLGENEYQVKLHNHHLPSTYLFTEVPNHLRVSYGGDPYLPPSVRVPHGMSFWEPHVDAQRHRLLRTGIYTIFGDDLDFWFP